MLAIEKYYAGKHKGDGPAQLVNDISEIFACPLSTMYQTTVDI